MNKLYRTILWIGICALALLAGTFLLTTFWGGSPSSGGTFYGPQQPSGKPTVDWNDEFEPESNQ